MFNWLTKRRRRKLMQAPFPPEWLEILRSNLAHYHLLDQDEQERLQQLIAVFVTEKKWEGCGDLELTDEIRITISAMACLLILNLSHNFYENVESILVYPYELVLPQRKLGFFETATGPLEPEYPVSGEAFEQGPLILVWEAVLDGIRYAGYGFNVVFHEFAHKLDMQNGSANGIPLLANRISYRDWVRICSREYLRHLKNVERGRQTFLDEYGAMDEAEFFAVATEHFFDCPLPMQKSAPELYRILKDYYLQDPAKRAKKYIGDNGT